MYKITKSEGSILVEYTLGKNEKKISILWICWK